MWRKDFNIPLVSYRLILRFVCIHTPEDAMMRMMMYSRVVTAIIMVLIMRA